VIAAALLCLAAAQAEAPLELELLAGSLRPEGRAELEANAGPISQLPIYEVEAELDPKAARVDGRLRLVFRNRESAALHELVLRLYPQAGRGASLRAEDVRIDGARVAARSHGSVLEVPISLAPSATAVLTLEFHGRLRRQREGDDDPLGASAGMLAQLAPGLAPLSGRARPPEAGYGTFAVSARGAALVDWYPQLASRSRGQWDRQEPGPLGDAGHADPASAVVALTVPKGWRVAGAGSALGQHAGAGHKEIATFAAAGIRGALGMAASPGYAELDERSGAVQLRAASLHGDAGARSLLACGRTALQALEPRFGPYPWKALTLAEVSLTGGAGGVEMPGLALVAQAISPRAAPAGTPAGLFDFTCFHEVAHQWWQAVVGSDPRRAPWVDEALAQYSAVLVEESSKGGGTAGKLAADEAESTFVALNYQGMRMAQLADGPVSRPADSFRSPLAYAGLIYGKAPLYFSRARSLMGDELFTRALREYRRRWAFREAGEGSWLEAAQWADPAHRAELAALERRWLRERHGDEDIGQPDAASLMEALGGGGTGVSQLLRLFQQGGGAGPGDRELREAMKALERLMPDLQRGLDPGSDGAPAEEEP
jgi:hypothetical protein